ncbi:MAG: leucine-rich repeat domain-containing protein [Candidatus Methylacidiphilales bacterium]
MFCQPFNITSPILVAGEYFEVFYKKSTDVNYISFLPNPTTQDFQICNLEALEYDFKIRKVNADGTKCKFVKGSFNLCTAIAFDADPMPEPIANDPYFYILPLVGTAPFVLTNIVKPSWMAITVVGNAIEFTGTPPTDDFAIISLTVSNCNGSLDFIDEIGVCTLASYLVAPGTMPNALVGQPYNYSIQLSGSQPFNLSNIVKPNWMVLTVVGNTVNFTGTPNFIDEAGEVTIDFDITNCSNTVLDFNGLIDVNVLMFSFTITGNDRLNRNGGLSRASFYVNASFVKVDWYNNGTYVDAINGPENYSSPNYPDNLPRTIKVKCTPFDNLSFINGNYNVDSVNLSNLPLLKTLLIAKNEFTVAPDLSGNPILENIVAYDSFFTSMPIFVSNSLKELDLQGSSHFPINTPFNASNFAGVPNLQDLNLSYSNISGVVDIAGMTNLKNLNLFKNKITNFITILNLKNISLNKNILSVASVNSILAKLVIAWTSSPKSCLMGSQTPAAAPTGQGITDKNTLIGIGCVIQTD